MVLFDDSSDVRDELSETDSGQIETAEARIDWDRFTPADRATSSETSESDTAVDATTCHSAIERSSLLDANADLDPDRFRVDVSRLHPDRFEPATADQQKQLEEQFRADPTPETLARGINPGFYSDDPDDYRGRLTNCGDCARAFQEGLEGHPRVAARIDDRGLPAAGEDDGPGENKVYLEQWAGKRALATDPDRLERDLRSNRGSAIVLGFSHEGGHAFNAYWDERTSTVRLADAQAGFTADWDSTELRKRWPHVEAITFPRGENRS